MRRALHAVLAILGAVPWLIAYFCGALCIALARLGVRIWPEADMGNCWSHALPLWHRRRDVLLLTFVEDARFLRIFPVLHCVWMPAAPTRGEFSMTTPVERKASMWFPWWAFYFRYRVVTIERRTKHRDE